MAIVVVTNPAYDKCLLVRQPRLPTGIFTAIAGYVEVGKYENELSHKRVGPSERTANYIPVKVKRSKMLLSGK